MIKKIIINIECFLLTIFVFLLLILTVVLNTIFNKNYMLDILEKNNYYENTYFNLKDTIESYTIQSGLDTSLFLNLFNKEKVKNDINILIYGIYDNKEIVIEVESIKENLITIIDNKLKENNRITSNDERLAIDEFINTILEVYEEEIVYSNEIVNELKLSYPKIKDFLIKLSFIIALIIFFVAVTIIFINKNIKISIKKICISLLTTSLLLITLWGLLETRFQHILILNQLVSKVLIYILTDIINKYLVIGLIVLVFSLIGILNSCKE